MNWLATIRATIAERLCSALYWRGEHRLVTVTVRMEYPARDIVTTRCTHCGTH